MVDVINACDEFENILATDLPIVPPQTKVEPKVDVVRVKQAFDVYLGLDSMLKGYNNPRPLVADGEKITWSDRVSRREKAKQEYLRKKNEKLKREGDYRVALGLPRRSKSRKPNAFHNDLCKELIRFGAGFGFDLTYVDVSSYVNGSFRRKSSEFGVSDLIGNVNGLACFIEVKTHKSSSLSEKQRMFLERKIYSGCFAMRCFSPNGLKTTYGLWLAASDADTKKKILLNTLG